MAVFFLMVAAAVAIKLLGADAFVLPSTNCCSTRHHRAITICTSLMPLSRKLALGVHGENLTEQSVKDMEELIVSLSKEPTDETRRERVQKIFDEKLQKGAGGGSSSSSENAQQFSNLFHQVLIVVGDRTREKAAALQLAAAKNDNLESAVEAGEKSEAERQVWALVDMMIQSKMIVKRASINS